MSTLFLFVFYVYSCLVLICIFANLMIINILFSMFKASLVYEIMFGIKLCKVHWYGYNDLQNHYVWSSVCREADQRFTQSRRSKHIKVLFVSVSNNRLCKKYLTCVIVYNKYLYFFGEPPRVKTRRDAADRCRGRNRRGVTPRIIAECLGMMPREYSFWMRSNFENKRVCPRLSRGFCWLCVSCTEHVLFNTF